MMVTINDKQYPKQIFRPALKPIFFGSLCYFLLILIPSSIRRTGCVDYFSQVLSFRQFFETIFPVFLAAAMISIAITAWAIKYPRIICKRDGMVFFTFTGNRVFISWHQITSCGIRNFIGLKHLIIKIINRKGLNIYFYMPLFLIDRPRFRTAVKAYAGFNNPVYKVFEKYRSYNRLATKGMIAIDDEDRESAFNSHMDTTCDNLKTGMLRNGLIAFAGNGNCLGIMPDLLSVVENPFSHKQGSGDSEKEYKTPIGKLPFPRDFQVLMAKGIQKVAETGQADQIRYQFGNGDQIQTYLFELIPTDMQDGKATTVLVIFVGVQKSGRVGRDCLWSGGAGHRIEAGTSGKG